MLLLELEWEESHWVQSTIVYLYGILSDWAIAFAASLVSTIPRNRVDAILYIDVSASEGRCNIQTFAHASAF